MLFALFAKQVQSQPDKEFNNQIHPLAVLDEKNVKYKDLEAERMAKEKWELEKRLKQYGFDPCSCVSAAKYWSGIDIGAIGYAKNHPINTIWPSIGAIIMLDEGNETGHLAVVIDIIHNDIRIKEANYEKCRITERTMRIDDLRIKGYYNPNLPL